MPSGTYYNDNDPYCADWLRGLIRAGLIPDGEVDRRGIESVSPGDVRGFRQAHFFAGLGGWAYALRAAGWPDERAVWTGSPPCQPFSVAGKGLGEADSRHLWPDLFRLVRAVRPAVLMGEQVASPASFVWFDGVAADLDSAGYACRAVDLTAAAVGAPHIRQRLYWLGHARYAERWQGLPSGDELDRATAGRPQDAGQPGTPDACPWAPWDVVGPDEVGRLRRLKPGVHLLANGVPRRGAKLRALANAIVAPLAVEVIKAYMEAYDCE